MKVGDLVTYSSPAITGNFVGLVTEVGHWTGPLFANCDVKVLWAGESEPATQKSFHLKLLTNS